MIADSQVMDRSALCGISIDVDSIRSHLRGYGVASAEDQDQHLLVAVPRALEIFSRLGATATFFIIAEDAVRQPDIIRRITAAGHEVASHSMTHRLPFSADIDEIFGSKEKLEQISGAAVAGFRAPSWDFEPELYVRLAQAGYRYDASAFPSWMLLLYRLSVRKRAVGSEKQVGMPPLAKMFGPALPYRIKLNWTEIAELPVSTAAVLRIPWYHTMKHLVPRAAFSVIQRLTLSRNGPVQYVLHAVDFLGLKEDGIDERLNCHPGMNRSLQSKLEEIEALLAAVGRRRKLVSLVRIIDQIPPAASALCD